MKSEKLFKGPIFGGVSQISNEVGLDEEAKFNHAVNGSNGLWLCQNHHKLFDSNIIMIDNDGQVRIKDGLVTEDVAFIRNTTFKTSLDKTIMSSDFRYYISKRNETLDLSHSHKLVI